MAYAAASLPFVASMTVTALDPDLALGEIARYAAADENEP